MGNGITVKPRAGHLVRFGDARKGTASNGRTRTLDGTQTIPRHSDSVIPLKSSGARMQVSTVELHV
jgi:hypothetical protein